MSARRRLPSSPIARALTTRELIDELDAVIEAQPHLADAEVSLGSRAMAVFVRVGGVHRAALRVHIGDK